MNAGKFGHASRRKSRGGHPKKKPPFFERLSHKVVSLPPLVPSSLLLACCAVSCCPSHAPCIVHTIEVEVFHRIQIIQMRPMRIMQIVFHPCMCVCVKGEDREDSRGINGIDGCR